MVEYALKVNIVRLALPFRWIVLQENSVHSQDYPRLLVFARLDISVFRKQLDQILRMPLWKEVLCVYLVTIVPLALHHPFLALLEHLIRLNRKLLAQLACLVQLVGIVKEVALQVLQDHARQAIIVQREVSQLTL